MFDEGKLWKERLAWTSKELARYLRYIFTGHLVIVFMFLLGSGAYYYQEYVKNLQPDFPAALIMATIIGIFLTYSPIYTFLLEADRIFLLPLESKLSSYFKKSISISFVIQIYILLMVLAIFMPIYVQVYQGSFQSFFIFLRVIALIKFWNLLQRWQIQHYVNPQIHLADTVVRYCLNVLSLYFLFTNGIIWMGGMILILIIIFGIFRMQTKEMGLKWEYLIDLEEKRMTSFYRIANLFTDVPKFKDRVKRRRWLDWILGWISFRSGNTYLFLYMRSFLRAGDYFGLFVRLTVIGAAALYLVSFGFGQILLVLLFIYLIGFQLLPLANHHQNKIWVSLYPIDNHLKEKSFLKLLFVILFLDSVIMSFVLLLKGDVVVSLASLVCGIVFSLYFVFSFSKKRLKLS
ncbi:ABC transporter permease [Bacillus sp. 1NLA3E]|uniref:ABC transporter permease n=1 Tax=Bacillus sp. 1NLA3E TaxID=666686 RepID=UPI000247E745|nr:ABC transporter permease [Bacillus sp. 1NLA3E]AGK52554.1 ABC transporter permease [Bacillus sp. 1NLA3E]